jgi:hypothetical protein
MRRLVLPLLAIACVACNDLTEPLPAIQGTYDYVAVSSSFTSLNRRGTITIVDSNPRTASFDGTFSYVDPSGSVTGRLIGAFVTPNHVWFRFLDERFLFHEADLSVLIGTGELYQQGITYEPVGATFTLRRR